MHGQDSSLSLKASTGGYAFTSYGTNEYFTGYYNGYSGAGGKVDLVDQPSKVFFMSDAQSPNPYDYNVLRASVAESTLFDILSSNFSGRLAYERHEQQVVVSFIDGHVVPFQITDLDQVWLSKGISQ